MSKILNKNQTRMRRYFLESTGSSSHALLLAWSGIPGMLFVGRIVVVPEQFSGHVLLFTEEASLSQHPASAAQELEFGLVVLHVPSNPKAHLKNSNSPKSETPIKPGLLLRRNFLRQEALASYGF